jgi:hypothetical protein
MAVAAAATISGAVILFLTPEGRSSIAMLQSLWWGPQPQVLTWEQAFPTRKIFAQLNVIDNSRDIFSFDEQEALFRALSGILRDPSSAQVRKLKRTNDSKYGICGEVNSKNGFGGYVGFAPFAGVLTSAVARIQIFDQEVVDKMPEATAAALAKFGCPY